jgi:succinate dehydrogenase/fumarate reductase flavoprotein subunit
VSRPDLVVAGAGLAGLSAAVRARQHGARIELYEKAERPGGCARLSSGYVWRYRSFERYREECPHGDEALQRAVHDGLDEALDWLVELGAPLRTRDTGNPRTSGAAFDPDGLIETLAGAAGEIRLGEPLTALPDGVPVILATGGFAANPELVRTHVTPHADRLWLRATPHSTGDGLRLGLAAGGTLSEGMDEFYGRNLPAPPARIGEAEFRGAQQLYGRYATVRNARGERYAVRTWSEIDVVQWTARQPDARAFYEVPDEALDERVRERTVRDMVAAAEAAGGPVEHREGSTVVEVAPAITTTLGGLAIDPDGRVAAGVHAAGNDAGGWSTGGYMSGLAAALVLGRRAADAALGAS